MKLNRINGFFLIVVIIFSLYVLSNHTTTEGFSNISQKAWNVIFYLVLLVVVLVLGLAARYFLSSDVGKVAPLNNTKVYNAKVTPLNTAKVTPLNTAKVNNAKVTPSRNAKVSPLPYP